MMTSERLHYLLERYFQQSCTEEERQELMQALPEAVHEVQLKDWIDTGFHRPLPAYAMDRQAADEILGSILQVTPQRETPVVDMPAGSRRRPFFRWVAAAVLVILSAGLAWWLLRSPGQEITRQTITPARIEPGKTGAILTLADGRQLVLDSLGNGLLANEGGSAITLANGQLYYDARSSTEAAVYNTMTTPRGRQFQLRLPDGTAVWLNAASSIRFPSVFAGKERKVRISGEVYFEVQEEKGRPFIVETDRESVVVTKHANYNINVYADMSVSNTTLLEGGLLVSLAEGEAGSVAPSAGLPLKPGQQARLSGDAGKRSLQLVSQPDLEKVMAWKNGFFNFEGAGLEEVMQQLARWYDIDVLYPQGIPEMTFGGEMSRSLPLADVLELLQRARVKFRVEDGKRVVVLP